jgi:hypothetical protein
MQKVYRKGMKRDITRLELFGRLFRIELDEMEETADE